MKHAAIVLGCLLAVVVLWFFLSRLFGGGNPLDWLRSMLGGHA